MNGFKTLKDHVYDYIEAQIQNGSLRSNQRINEAAICEKLNISRTPVREALIQLSAEGVLENTARKGFVLKEIKEQDVRELYAVIGILDGFAAKLSCTRLTESDLSDMAFYISAMDLAIQSGNYPMYDKHQLIFHKLYMEKCGNRVLVETIERAKKKLLKRTYIDDPDESYKEILSATNQEHREILALFQKQDGDGLLTYISEVHWRPAHVPCEIGL